MNNNDPTSKTEIPPSTPDLDSDAGADNSASDATNRPKEIGGRDGPDPTRYGDWEKNGRCIDF
jgi:hypothetical protein